MYSDTSWLGRIGFDDNPTTAIVLYLRKMPAIGSPPLCAPNSDPSGTSTLIASLLPSLLSSVLRQHSAKRRKQLAIFFRSPHGNAHGLRKAHPRQRPNDHAFPQKFVADGLRD